MPGSYEVITFDCYGTLIDWEGGISEAFLEAAAQDGLKLERQSVLEAYEEIEPIVEAVTYRSYREVLGETARRIAERLGWPISKDRASFLAESLPGWRPFPDTNAAPDASRLHKMSAPAVFVPARTNLPTGPPCAGSEPK